MADLLDTIVESSRRRTAERRARQPLEEIRARVRDAPPARSLGDALSRGFSVIAEHKRRSPTGGEMGAANLERAFSVYARTPWISALSVLTDADHFHGSLEDLLEARSKSGARPILRKDFVVEEYQVWEARAFGADALLLMTTLFFGDRARLHGLFDLTRELGMEALFEIGMEGHAPEALVELVPDAARLWGINSRRFDSARAAASQKTLKETGRDPLTSLERHERLRALVPQGRLAVAESGIAGADDLHRVRALGYHAALIGTGFLRGSRRIEDAIADLGAAF